MRAKAIILSIIFLLSFSFQSTAQRGGRPSSSYRPSTYKPYNYGKNRYKGFESRYGKKYNPYGNPYSGNLSGSLRLIEAFKGFERITVLRHKQQWETLKEVLPKEQFEQIHLNSKEYYVEYNEGKVEVLQKGEIVSHKFTIKNNSSEFSITPIEAKSNERFRLVFDEYFWTNSKSKSFPKNFDLFLLGKSGFSTYRVNRVKIGNGETKFMGSYKKGVWFEVGKGNFSQLKKNLERKIDFSEVKVLSMVSDSKTNLKLQNEIKSNLLNYETKTELLNALSSQPEGNTIFLIGHHEGGKFIRYNGKGEKVIEVTAEELNSISKERKINIFPLGCKTAFSRFNEGASKNINSLKIVEAFIEAKSTSKNFGELLEKMASSSADLNFVVTNESFGNIRIEVVESKSQETYPVSQVDTLNSIPIIKEPVRLTHSGIGNIFINSPYATTELDIWELYNSSYTPISDYTPDYSFEDDYKSSYSDDKSGGGIGILGFGIILFFLTGLIGTFYEWAGYSDDQQPSWIGNLALISLFMLFIGGCNACL